MWQDDERIAKDNSDNSITIEENSENSTVYACTFITILFNYSFIISHYYLGSSLYLSDQSWNCSIFASLGWLSYVLFPQLSVTWANASSKCRNVNLIFCAEFDSSYMPTVGLWTLLCVVYLKKCFSLWTEADVNSTASDDFTSFISPSISELSEALFLTPVAWKNNLKS